jgi:hypothetical protein
VLPCRNLRFGKSCRSCSDGSPVHNPKQKAIAAAVPTLKPADVASRVAPLLGKLLEDPYADVRTAALRQAAPVGAFLLFVL